MQTDMEKEKRAEAQRLIQKLAEPWKRAKDGQRRAHRLLRAWTWTPNRIVDVWKADRRIKISANELETLRALAHGAEAEGVESHLEALLARIEKSEREVVELRTRLARLEIRGAEPGAR
jgi:hypothetical protein